MQFAKKKRLMWKYIIEQIFGLIWKNYAARLHCYKMQFQGSFTFEWTNKHFNVEINEYWLLTTPSKDRRHRNIWNDQESKSENRNIISSAVLVYEHQRVIDQSTWQLNKKYNIKWKKSIFELKHWKKFEENDGYCNNVLWHS